MAKLRRTAVYSFEERKCMYRKCKSCKLLLQYRIIFILAEDFPQQFINKQTYK